MTLLDALLTGRAPASLGPDASDLPVTWTASQKCRYVRKRQRWALAGR